MAVNRRAAMRRENRERQKVHESALKAQRKGDHLSKHLMAECFSRGRDEGLELACGIIFLALHEHFGFGQKRLMKLMDCIGKESLKMDEDATKFNVEWYIKQLREKCNISIER